MNKSRDELAKRSAQPLSAPLTAPFSIEIADSPVSYETALGIMEARVEAIANNEASEHIWLLEHPPLYTAGTSARDHDFLGYADIPVFKTGRGGEYTYHGPGQRIAYVMLNLTARGGDVRRFVADLEEVVIRTLAAFNVRGERREDRVGVWVRRPERGPKAEDKIAAIGIRVRRGITFHGFSLNVDPNLDHYRGIVPCGIKGTGALPAQTTSPETPQEDYGVTSLLDLGLTTTMEDVDLALIEAFKEVLAV
jgi:lipoyl(octanoyl) transferase